MRHGDSKTTFNTGAQRDTAEGKGRPSLISPALIHRLGVLLEKGAEHYGADNWAKGMPYRRTADSMIRHIFQWLAGDHEEDHLAAVCFGAMCLMTYEDNWMQAEVRLAKDGSCRNESSDPMDDRCRALKKILPSILTTQKEPPTLEHDPDEKQQTLYRCRCGCLTMDYAGVCVTCQKYKVPREGK